MSRTDRASSRAAALAGQLDQTRRQLQAMRGTTVWRLFEALMSRLRHRPRLLRLLRTGLWRTRHLHTPKAQRDVTELLASPFFDPAWYAARYPDAPQEPRAAAANYLAHTGAARNPGPEFDASWYLAQNPDVGLGNPLLHYLRVGRHRLHAPSAAWARRTHHARAQALGVELAIAPLRLVIGCAGPADPAALARLVRSALLSATQAGQMSCPVQPGTGNTPAAHNHLMSQAARDGASLYIAAKAVGIFDPSCIQALLRMSAAQAHRALIAASAFPQENPKSFDVENFDTGWALGDCLLIPLALVRDIGGLDEELEHFWDVDLSWRARQAGYGVKNCPPALFHTHNPLAEWLDDAALASAYRLAWLWGHDAAQAEIGAEISRNGGALPTLAARPPTRRDPQMADFAHGFGFAPARW